MPRTTLIPVSRNGTSAPKRSSRASSASDSGTKKKKLPTTAIKKEFYASIFPGKQQPLPEGFVSLVRELETNLGMPVWFVIQNGSGKNNYETISPQLANGFTKHKSSLPKGKPIALLLDSPGGYARCAYQIANLLRKHCGSFTVVIPQYAKSAATLLSLGANTILLGEDAELGPLDAQFQDSGREEVLSALDEVQSVERLFASSLDAVDQTMQLLAHRTQKKVETLLAPVLHFVAEMMEPLFAKIDTVHYTQYSRVLKVAEEYAVRLLIPKYTPEVAKKIARFLVERYPEHAFVIDAPEAEKIGLKTAAPSAAQTVIIEKLQPYLNSLTVSGKLEAL